MSTEENKAIARRMYQIFASGSLDTLDQVVSPNIVDHNPGPDQAPGSQGIKDFFREIHRAFSNVHVTVEDQVAESDKVVSRVTYTGKQTGEYLGIPPTGEEVTVTAMDMLRVANGKVVDRWGNEDDLGMLQQLGAVPQTGTAQRRAA